MTKYFFQKATVSITYKNLFLRYYTFDNLLASISESSTSISLYAKNKLIIFYILFIKGNELEYVI